MRHHFARARACVHRIARRWIGYAPGWEYPNPFIKCYNRGWLVKIIERLQIATWEIFFRRLRVARDPTGPRKGGVAI